MSKILALIEKDSREMLKNKYLLIVFLTPIIVAIFVSEYLSEVDPTTNLIMWVSFTIIISGFSLLSIIVSEEKEKGNIENILFSLISYKEFILGKLFCGTILTILTSLIVTYLLVHTLIFPIMFYLIILISSLCFSLLGVILGLKCPNQISAEAALSIVTIILLLPTFYLEDKIMNAIMHLVPSYYLINGIASILSRKSNYILYILVILAICIFEYVYIYKILKKSYLSY